MLALGSKSSPLENKELQADRLAELEKRCASLKKENASLQRQSDAAESELRALSENLLDIVFFLDEHANLCRLGGNTMGILGLVSSMTRPVPPERWLTYFATDDQTLLRDAIANLDRFCASGLSLHVRARDEADEYRWLELTLHPTDVESHPRFYSGTARDITENRSYAQLMGMLDKAASRIRQPGLTQQDILRAVTDELHTIGLNSVIAFLEPDGLFRIETVSLPPSQRTAISDLVGVAAGKIVDLTRVVPVQNALRTGQAQFFEITRDVISSVLGSDRQRWVGAIQGMIKDSRAICAPIVSADVVRGVLIVLSSQISKRWKPALAAFATQTAIAMDNAELISQLAESERRYRRVFEAVSEGLVLVNDKGHITSANRTACKLFGRRDTELANLRILKFFDSTALIAISKALGKASPQPFRVQSSLTQRSGQVLNIELDGTGFLVQGRPGLLLTITDITERIQSEKTLMHSEKLRALGQMAGGVAHDFNNLLHVIQGFTSLAITELTIEPDTAQEDLNRVLKATDDAAEAVRRLQSLYRKADDQSDFGQVDLAEIISDAIDLNSPRWKDEYQQRGRTIHIDTQIGYLPQIRGNGSELRRVFSNLIINAIDAMPTGGTVHIDARAHEGQCIVSFSDSGCGMPLNKLERIFEPFYTTKGQAGSGLGLTVSKRIIERHGGSICATSQIDVGTTFTLTLPAATSEPPSQSLDESCIPAVSPAQLQVLVVDDDPAIRTIVTRFLLMRGHHVLHAGDGQEALDSLSQESFDLIITDLGMPDVSGRRVIEVAREHQPNVPIILSTGWGDSITPAQLEQLGANALLTKPFSVSDLSRALETALPGA